MFVFVKGRSTKIKFVIMFQNQFLEEKINKYWVIYEKREKYNTQQNRTLLIVNVHLTTSRKIKKNHHKKGTVGCEITYTTRRIHQEMTDVRYGYVRHFGQSFRDRPVPECQHDPMGWARKEIERFWFQKGK